MLAGPKAAVIVCLFSEVFSDYGAVQASCLDTEALGVVWISRDNKSSVAQLKGRDPVRQDKRPSRTYAHISVPIYLNGGPQYPAPLPYSFQCLSWTFLQLPMAGVECLLEQPQWQCAAGLCGKTPSYRSIPVNHMHPRLRAAFHLSDGRSQYVGEGACNGGFPAVSLRCRGNWGSTTSVQPNREALPRSYRTLRPSCPVCVQ